MTGNDIIHVDNNSNQGFDAFQVQGSLYNPQGIDTNGAERTDKRQPAIGVV